MIEKTLKTTFQLRRGNAVEWTSQNPRLAAGEPGFELDTGKLKIGDGLTSWNDLNYVSNDSGNTNNDKVYVQFAIKENAEEQDNGIEIISSMTVSECIATHKQGKTLIGLLEEESGNSMTITACYIEAAFAEEENNLGVVMFFGTSLEGIGLAIIEGFIEHNEETWVLYQQEINSLPNVTSEDNNKVLTVYGGEWQARSLPFSDIDGNFIVTVDLNFPEGFGLNDIEQIDWSQVTLTNFSSNESEMIEAINNNKQPILHIKYTATLEKDGGDGQMTIPVKIANFTQIESDGQTHALFIFLDTITIGTNVFNAVVYYMANELSFQILPCSNLNLGIVHIRSDLNNPPNYTVQESPQTVYDMINNGQTIIIDLQYNGAHMSCVGLANKTSSLFGIMGTVFLALHQQPGLYTLPNISNIMIESTKNIETNTWGAFTVTSNEVGYVVPPCSDSDAGKVLKVNSNGTPEWVTE